MTHITAKLRILATTDLHMNLSGFDYACDAPGGTTGLAGLSTMVTAARAEARSQGRSSVLLDNGDFLQGTALADWQSELGTAPEHPLIRILNAMEYDAIGLGNHDLDYGTDYLSGVIDLLDAPTVSTNLSSGIIAGLHPHILLKTSIETSQGTAPLTIGILSALPVETAIWNTSQLPSGTRIHDPVVSLGTAAKKLRQDGAELIIALAHMGITPSETQKITGNSGATALAQVPDIDVVIAGHTHQRYPLTPITGTSSITAAPIVMPGHYASDLGVIDLDLVQTSGGIWDIGQYTSALWPNKGTVTPDPTTIRLSTPAHQATRAYLAEPVAEIGFDLHSYFGMVRPTDTLALAARSKAFEVKQGLAGHGFDHLPILATATTRTVGERSGPSNYIHIPQGPVLRRHLANFAPATNRICALQITGSMLRNWLEHSACVYNQLSPDTPDQQLRDERNPSFIFDTIYGLDYVINPSRPVGERITSLMHAGAPVTADQQFIIATNHFRAAGGGGYTDLNLPAPLFQSDMTPVQAIVQALQRDDLAEWVNITPWQLNCGGTFKAVFESSPTAARYFSQISALCPEILGHTETGFDRIQITL